MFTYLVKPLIDLLDTFNTIRFQGAPANTTAYMIAGYAVIFGVMALYLISVIVRFRNLKQELEILQDLS